MHVLSIGDSVDRHMVQDVCLAHMGNMGNMGPMRASAKLVTWGTDWHLYKVKPSFPLSLTLALFTFPLRWHSLMNEYKNKQRGVMGPHPMRCGAALGTIRAWLTFMSMDRL